MKAYLHRFIIFAITAFLIITPPITYAASPSGWSVSPADIIINGASATVTAIRGAGSSALQSTIKHAPTAANVGKKILKGAGAGAVLMAVTQILGKAVDYTLDPANNAVKYYDETPGVGKYWGTMFGAAQSYDTFQAVVDGVCRGSAATYKRVSDTQTEVSCRYYGKDVTFTVHSPAPITQEKFIPISQVAAKVISNAESGHAPSQELIKTVIIDDVESGALDVPLNTNAVPKADNPPVTDPNNPPVTDPNNPPQVPPFDPSSIIAAIKSVMAAVVNMSGVLGAKIDALMVDLGIKQAETIEAINTGTSEIVAANDRTGARVAEIVAAIEAIEGNTLDGQLINDAIDRVIANDNAKVGDIVAAIEAIEGNTLDGQLINDAIDRVIANDNVNAQAANDVVSQSVDKAIDAADAASQAQVDAIADSSSAVVDAIDTQTGAITQTDPETGDISLKFPTFCGWAGTVCDLVDWVMADDATMEDTPVPVSETVIDQPSSFDKPYISAPSQCPPDVEKNIPIGSNSFNFVVPMTPVCDFGANVISPVLYFIALLQAAFIIGSAFKVG